MTVASIANPASAKVVVLGVAAIVAAGLLLNWGYNNNTPVLRDAAKGFK